jgi:stearoyl-CoA desaturase (delta-9 desaturase)
MSELKNRHRREKSQTQFAKSFVRDDHLSERSFWARLNKLNCIIVFGTPLLALYGVCTIHKFVWQTWLSAVIYYIWTGLGITAGYHRLWSHGSWKCNKILETFLMIGATGSLQGSIKWWCLLHRAHHRWTDTDSDPYNSQRGFWYAHVGWLLFDNIHVNAHIPMKDLKSNSIVRWQHNNYAWFGPFMALIFPTIVGYLFCGDIRGGFYIAGALRLLFVHHATWFVNSLAHYIGKQSYDDTISPRDSLITGLLTLGEGYHNFHHEFPYDYRNGVKWYDYDPTKWFIYSMKCLGFAYNLNKFPINEIVKGEIDMIEKKLNERKQTINYAPPINTLPIWTQNEREEEMINAKKNGKIYVQLLNIIYDVTDWVASTKHPGGKAIIIQRNGKNITNDFNGNVYNHTNAARNILSHMQIARVYEE